MESMILAAGAGTRLRPLTNTTPKALVEIADEPILGRVMRRLVEAGTTRIIVNTHHHEDQIRAFLAEDRFDGIEIAISSEPDGPLDTGGGLFHASHLFREDSPFILHNVDVLSDIDFSGLLRRHTGSKSDSGEGPSVIASLAVMERDSARALLFDDHGLLGWENRGSDRAPDRKTVVRDSAGEVRRFSFTGLHVIEPSIFKLSDRTGIFSIITLYLELAREGWRIMPIDVTGRPWFDIGTPQRLVEASEWARRT